MAFNVPNYSDYMTIPPHYFGFTLHPDLHATVPKTGFIPRHVFHQTNRPSLLGFDDHLPLAAVAAHHAPNLNCLQYQPSWNDIRDGKVMPVQSNKKHKFQVAIDVKQFAPEEITVKVVKNDIVVEGEHDEKGDDHGWIKRTFSRRYSVPDECDLDKLESKISSDGILIISAPSKKEAEEVGERVIPIQTTHAPAILDKTIGKK